MKKKKFYVKCTIEGLDDKSGFEIVNEYKERAESLVRNANLPKPDKELVESAFKCYDKKTTVEQKTALGD